MAAGIRVQRRGVLRATALGLAMAAAPRWRASAQAPAAINLPAEGLALRDPDATADALTDAWFAMLSLTGAETGVLGTTDEHDARSREIIAPVLDPAFQLQRASGERYVASSYVPADIDLYEIVDVTETRPTDGLVVARYGVRTTGASTADSSLVMSDDQAPRLTVFHWDGAEGQWKVLSHANFNTPVAAICGHEPLVAPVNPSVPTSAADIALAQALIEEIGRLAMEGDVRPVFDPEIQAQSASGRGYATIANWMPSRYDRFEPADVLVTRNDDVLVTAYVALQAGTLHGEDIVTRRDPRISTWRLTEDGAWKQIAYAGFATPPELPDGETCVTSG